MRRFRTASFTLALGMLAACFLTVVAETPEAASGSSARSAKCDSLGSKTVIRTRAVRIFRKNGKTYGCHLDRGRAYALGDHPDLVDVGLYHFRAAGPVVAYELLKQDRQELTSNVLARDLRTGRRLRRAFQGAAQVTDLELRPTGSTAYIVELPFASPSQYEVRIAPRALPLFESTLLDSGADVDPRSLVLRGTTLYWTRGGVRRSVTLR